MIDASKGFMKDGNKNRLRSQDLHKIVDTFTKQIEIDRYSRMVPLREIADPKNDYNLNIPRYIDSSEPEDLHDLHAHLHGGIPDRDLDALSDYWDAFPQLRGHLFTPNRPGYSDLAIDVSQVQQAILDSTEFQQFTDEARTLTTDWFAAHRDTLAAIDEDTTPNDLIAALGDDLLARFKPIPLLDEYDIYEQLMTYWHEVMHDDVYLILADGWLAAARPRQTIEDKDRKLSETPDLVVGSGRGATKYKTDLIPPALIVARYFADAQARIDELTAAADEATRAVEEYLEEHAVEDGLLADAMGDVLFMRGCSFLERPARRWTDRSLSRRRWPAPDRTRRTMTLQPRWCCGAVRVPPRRPRVPVGSVLCGGAGDHRCRRRPSRPVRAHGRARGRGPSPRLRPAPGGGVRR